MKLPHRFYLASLVVSLLPMVFFSTTLMTLAQTELRGITGRFLNLDAEANEGTVLGFINMQKVRVSDWASDNNIRELTMKLASTTTDPTTLPATSKELGQYIKDRKHALDGTVSGTAVIGNDGTVLASTIDSEVGKKLEEETLAIMRAHRPTPDAINKGFGYEVGVQSPIHFYTVLRTNADETVIGYIVNRVEAHELDKVLSGEMQISFGGLPGNIMRGATAETILIDRENGLLLTSSRFIANAPGKIRDAVLPVEECLTSGYEASGAWKDYRGIPVYGAAMCPRDTFFILVSKIDVTEVEEGFVAMRRATEVIASIIALFTIFAHAWLHTILEKRMEIECETRKNIPKK